MVSFYSLINIFSKIIMGFLFDRFGLKSGVLFGAIGTVGCYAFMIVASFSPSLAMLFVFSFLFGIGLATQSMFMPSLIGGIYGKQQYSIIYGKFQSSLFSQARSATLLFHWCLTLPEAIRCLDDLRCYFHSLRSVFIGCLQEIHINPWTENRFHKVSRAVLSRLSLSGGQDAQIHSAPVSAGSEMRSLALFRGNIPNPPT